MKHYLAIALIALLYLCFQSTPIHAVSSTLKNKSPQKADITAVFGLNNIAIDPVYKGCGIYKDSLYITTAYPTKYAVEFRSFDGKVSREISIPMGKGPGEIQFLTGLKINNDVIYIYDYAFKKIEMYAIDGKYIDSVILDDKLTSMVFDVTDDGFIFEDDATQSMILVGKDGKQKAVYQLNPGKPSGHNTVYQGGSLYVDPLNNTVYLGKASFPYTIVHFDAALKEKNDHFLESEEEL